MATAKKLPSGSWRCLVYSHTETVKGKDGIEKQKRIYESFTSDDPSAAGKREAEYAAAKYALNKKEKSKVSHKTYGECLNDYIENRTAVLSPSTIREYKRSRRCDLQDLADMRICDLTQAIIQKSINRESQTHSPKSVRNMHGLLSAVLKEYRPNFALNTTLPQKVRPKIHVPTDAEIQALMTYIEDTEMEIPILLAAFGPMRRGEICALDSMHINKNIVHVAYAIVLNDKNEWVRKSTKTYDGDRLIEFPDFVIKKLEHKSGQIVNLLPSQISDRFSDVLKRAGIPHFRFHDLRHYNASVSHALGIPDQYIMKRGGWASDAVLKNVYRHTMSDRTEQMNQIANDHFINLCNTKCNTTS